VTLVILPTYNEADNIEKMLREILRENPTVDILVVDDNSPDGTAKIVQAFQKGSSKIHLLNRPRKEGLAAAYIAGFSWGLSHNYQVLVEMDADFSHSPKDLTKLLEKIEESDVVVGCRYVTGGGTVGWSRLREFISRGGNIYAKTFLRLPYSDLTGGFTAWRREVLEKIDISTIRSKGYAFQVELKYHAHHKGFKMIEVPIHFRNRQMGKSKMSGQIVWEAAFRVLQLRRV